MSGMSDLRQRAVHTLSGSKVAGVTIRSRSLHLRGDLLSKIAGGKNLLGSGNRGKVCQLLSF